jgi:cell division transport system permease protein
MKPGFFLKEALRTIKRNAIPSFAAMASILVTVLVLGVFIPIVQATTGAANEVRGRVMLDVYAKKSATKADLARLHAKILATPNVKSVQFVSKEQAYAEQKKQNPEAYALLGSSNPLPDLYRITPKSADDVSSIRNALVQNTPGGGSAPVDPAIATVRDRKDDTDKILSVTRVVKLTVGVLALLLIAASILLISNTIRLSLFARRREVEVMKLVGATDSFIRWPFLIEGIVLGLLGGGTAIVMLGIGKIALFDPLSNSVALIAKPETMGFLPLVLILLAAAIGVSTAGTGLSLRRFLRV